MLAARDQENLVHNHQATAAAKPLNHGLKQPPKTPANKFGKTPFRVPLNDENDGTAFAGKKSVLKGDGKGDATGGLGGGKRTALANKNAFVTPMGPRNRAPLGMKTTNTKTRVFKTPGSEQQKSVPGMKQQPLKDESIKRKPKTSISPAKLTKVDPKHDNQVLTAEEEEPDIEYMPPKPKELPDYPDDFPPRDDYPQFKGANFARGWHSTYVDPIDENGERRSARQLREKCERYDREIDEYSLTVLDEMPALEDLYLGSEKKKRDEGQTKLTKKPSIPRTNNGVTTALQTKQSQLKAKPTQSQQRLKSKDTRPPSSMTGLKKPGIPPRTANSSAAAKATSRNTLGYAAGRKASAQSPGAAKTKNAGTDGGKTTATSNRSLPRKDDWLALFANNEKLEPENTDPFRSIFNDEDENSNKNNPDVDDIEERIQQLMQDDIDEDFQLML